MLKLWGIFHILNLSMYDGNILFIAYIYAKWKWFLCVRKLAGEVGERESARESCDTIRNGTHAYSPQKSLPLYSVWRARIHRTNRSGAGFCLYYIRLPLLLPPFFLSLSHFHWVDVRGVLVFIVVLLSYCFVPIHVSYMWCGVYAVRRACCLYI